MLYLLREIEEALFLHSKVVLSLVVCLRGFFGVYIGYNKRGNTVV